MKRDFMKLIEKGREMIRKTRRLDMYTEDLMGLSAEIKAGNYTTDAMWKGLSEAYYLGLYTGFNAGKREAARAAAKTGKAVVDMKK